MNLWRVGDFNFDTPTYPGKHVTVFGAGNVAMDAARGWLCALGAESSTIIYCSRSRAESPARHEEIEHHGRGRRKAELVGPLHFNASERRI